jgi:hypothetical protein
MTAQKYELLIEEPQDRGLEPRRVTDMRLHQLSALVDQYRRWRPLKAITILPSVLFFFFCLISEKRIYLC